MHDARQQFATRFNAIARLQHIEHEGMLVLDECDIASRITQADVNSQFSEARETSADIEKRLALTGHEPTPTLIVPGLLGDSFRNLVVPMMCARQRLEALRYPIDVAWVNGRMGCARNASILCDQVARAADTHGLPVNIIGYSKGCADCMHMLSDYPDIHDAVRSFVSLVGVVQGTPLAKDPSWLLSKTLQYIPVPGVPFGDGRAIADLSYEFRRQWLADHPLPANLYRATIAAAPERKRVSRILKSSYDKLSLVSKENDSQVIDADMFLPGGDLLAIVNADHWAVALPVNKRLPLIARLLVDQNEFPRDVLLRTLIEHLHDV